MKKLILLLFIPLFALASRLQAQNFWEQLPFPDTLDISCVAVNNEGHIFVGTGTAGPCVSDGVYRSTDGGQTWQNMLNMGTFTINTIGIDKSGHIYAGSSGAYDFWKSTDNGQSWQPLPFNPALGITKIYSFGYDSLLIGCSRTLGAMLLRTYDGGITFDTLFQTYMHISESVQDIAIAPNGDIYIGLHGWFPDAGGVVKSVDNGSAWQYMGLQGYQVKNIEINEQGDVFIGARDDGTYAIYHDNPDEIKFLFWPSNYGMILNSAGYLYSNSDWPYGTLRSIDNGMTFEWVSNGTSNAPIGSLIMDVNDYIYGISDGFPSLYRSKLPTYTSLKSLRETPKNSFYISRNESNNEITCFFTNPFIKGNKWQASIVGIDGKVLYREDKNIVDGTCKFDISTLPRAMYIVKFTKGAFSCSQKFVKP
jgi:photosystem II stability/assembly factor-like uncharacterized protein